MYVSALRVFRFQHFTDYWIISCNLSSRTLPLLSFPSTLPSVPAVSWRDCWHCRSGHGEMNSHGWTL